MGAPMFSRLKIASNFQAEGRLKIVDRLRLDPAARRRGETDRSLQRIVDQVTEINRVVAEIAASAKEQATAGVSVNQSIGEMDKATQQNAAITEESTAASHNLSDEAKRLAALIAEFEVAQAANDERPRPARRAAAAPLRKAG